MNFLKRLFGGGGDISVPESKPELYKGFRIWPEPIAEGPQHRIAARIEKDIGGETRTHHLIRADTATDRDEAVDGSLRKAKGLIDEQGDRLFN